MANMAAGRWRTQAIPELVVALLLEDVRELDDDYERTTEI